MTTRRVNFIATKWAAFEEELVSLEGIYERGDYEITNIKLRMSGLIGKYRDLEELKDELRLLQPTHALLDEFGNIRDRYYTIVASIENIISAQAETRSVASNNSGGGNSLRSEPLKRRIKLPTATLPTFDGKYEDWLGFKESFTAMIHSQTDLTNLEKFQYLKAALKGEAANKIKVFAMTSDNYAKAWKLLERSYEVKRLLINQHLAKLTNLPIQTEETSQGLNKLADDVQQHSQTLDSLGVSLPSEMLVHLVESKLHKKTADRWEESLERDEVPTIEKMCDFLYKIAVNVSRRGKRGESSQEHSTRGHPPLKRARVERHKQYVFTANTSRSCVACKNAYHPLYHCDKFKSLTIPKRTELVKKSKLCINCLRSHGDRPCVFGGCTICAKKHNTLLHGNSLVASKTSESSSNQASERTVA